MCRIKRMQMRGGFPCLQPQLHLPSPCICSANRVKRVALGREVCQHVAEALGPAIPAENQAQTQRALVYVPLHHEFHPLAFGEFGVKSL